MRKGTMSRISKKLRLCYCAILRSFGSKLPFVSLRDLLPFMRYAPSISRGMRMIISRKRRANVDFRVVSLHSVHAPCYAPGAV